MSKLLFNNKAYQYLKYFVLVIYVLFVLIYINRVSLYAIDNTYLTIFAGSFPNLISSFIFTFIGMFYVIPMLYKTKKALFTTKYIWIINAINIFIFLMIEYLHFIFKLGFWDNLDMIATLIGIILSTIIYFNFRKYFK